MHVVCMFFDHLFLSGWPGQNETGKDFAPDSKMKISELAAEPGTVFFPKQDATTDARERIGKRMCAATVAQTAAAPLPRSIEASYTR